MPTLSFLPEVEAWYERLLWLAGVLAAVGVVLFLVRHAFDRFLSRDKRDSFGVQATLFGLSLAGLIVVLLSLPIDPARRSDLLSIFGLLLSGAMALASTTFLGNILGGLLLRALRNFRVGDWIRCEGHFGRVSERGMFHTEIQTEDRNLTTLPNLYLVSRPVTVVHEAGTVLTASVSLGYDVPWRRVRELLVAATEKAELRDGFVQIDSLEDHSIVYRVGGLLEDVKGLLSARTRLRGAMLDELHGGGVEIVSPSFMNARALDKGQVILPEAPVVEPPPEEGSSTHEDLAFDKAEAAASLEEMEAERRGLEDRLEELRRDKDAPDGEARAKRLEARIERMSCRIEAAREEDERT